jgi:hypothetical protein
VAHHLVNPEREYRQLQKRLDRNVTGAPASPVFTEILKLLFTPEQATVARRLPTRPAPLDELSRKVGIPQEDLADRLEEMAGRGLVIDLEYGGKRYFSLPPVVIGLFEFTFMWTGKDVAIKDLALGRIVSVLEDLPPLKAAMAIKPLRSAFLNALVKRGANSSRGPSAVSAG